VRRLDAAGRRDMKGRVGNIQGRSMEEIVRQGPILGRVTCDVRPDRVRMYQKYDTFVLWCPCRERRSAVKCAQEQPDTDRPDLPRRH